MRDQSSIPLPEAGSLRVGPPPHWQGLPGIVPITMTFTLAAALAMSSGVALFGWYAVRVLATTVAVALLVESIFNVLKGRSRSWSESHALLIGVLFAGTLPPGVSWEPPVIGTIIAVILGEALAGGVGNYLWHPVALARVAIQILFHEELTPVRWPVLAPGRLFWGSLERAQDLPTLWEWDTYPVPPGIEAWSMIRPADHLRQLLPANSSDPTSALAVLVRDSLPPWLHTFFGVGSGAIGEACMLAIIIAGFLLIWRGFLRWPMLLSALAAAAVMAAVLPVRVQTTDGLIGLCSFPGAVVWDGLPVGLAYVAYHLTAGELLFVVFLLAADPSSSPLTRRGHLIFGAIIGAATILLRVAVGIPAAAYWALLLANTLVPMINPLTRRRVFGT